MVIRNEIQYVKLLYEMLPLCWVRCRCLQLFTKSRRFDMPITTVLCLFLSESQTTCSTIILPILSVKEKGAKHARREMLELTVNQIRSVSFVCVPSHGGTTCASPSFCHTEYDVGPKVQMGGHGELLGTFYLHSNCTSRLEWCIVVECTTVRGSVWYKVCGR